MKRRALLAAVLSALVLAGGALAPSAPPADASPVVAAKTCSRGFKHAVIGGVEKCLRAGEFCAHRYDRQYRRYGYRCIRFDRSVNRYRLTHA